MGKKSQYRNRPLSSNDSTSKPGSVILPGKVIHTRTTAYQTDRQPAKQTLTEIFAQGKESTSRKEAQEFAAPLVSIVDVPEEKDDRIEIEDGTPLGKIELSRSQRRRMTRPNKSKSLDVPEFPEPSASVVSHQESVTSEPSSGSSAKAGTGDAMKPPKPKSKKKKSKTTAIGSEEPTKVSTSDLRFSPITADLIEEEHAYESGDGLSPYAEIVKLRNQIAEKKRELEQKSNELKSTNEEGAKLLAENLKELAQLKKEVTDRQIKLDSYTARIEELEGVSESKGETENKLRNVLGQLDDFRKKCEIFDQKNEQLEQENQNLKIDLDKKMKEHSLAESVASKEIGILKKSVLEKEKKAMAEIESLRRALFESEAQLEVNISMISEMNTIRKELDEAQKKVAANVSLTSDLDSLRQQIEDDKESASQEVKELQDKLKDAEIELESTKIKLVKMEELERTNLSLEEKLANLALKLEKFESLTNEVEKLTQAQAQQEQKLVEYLAQMDKLRETNERLREQVKKADHGDNGYSSAMSSRSSPERTQCALTKTTEITVVSSDVQVSRLSDVFGNRCPDSTKLLTHVNEEPGKDAVTLAHIVDVEARPGRLEETLRSSGDAGLTLDSFGMSGFTGPCGSADSSAKNLDSNYTDAFMKANQTAAEASTLMPLIEPATDVTGAPNENGILNGKGKILDTNAVVPETGARRSKKLSKTSDLTFSSEAAAQSAEISRVRHDNWDQVDPEVSQDDKKSLTKEPLSLEDTGSNDKLIFLALCGGSFGLGVASMFAFQFIRR